MLKFYILAYESNTIIIASGIKEMRSTQQTQRAETEGRNHEERRGQTQEGTGSRNQEERRGINQEEEGERICQEEREDRRQQGRRSRNQHWRGNKRQKIKSNQEQMAGIGGRFPLPALDERTALSSPPPTANYEPYLEDVRFCANVEEQNLYENY